MEGSDATGLPDYPKMKADRHDFRRVRGFSMKPTEGVDHIDAKSPTPQNRMAGILCNTRDEFIRETR